MESRYLNHETKRNVLFRFLGVLLVVISYFFYVSYHFGVGNGFFVTLLTWTFFVFCTPIADAGFLLDFPIRLLIKIRMIYSEIFVWVLSASLNIFALFYSAEIYQKTFLLKLFYNILVHPFPYWLIIFLSAIGTFLSIYFGDELMDKVRHKERKKFQKHGGKHRKIVLLFILVAIILLYYLLIELMGMKF